MSHVLMFLTVLMPLLLIGLWPFRRCRDWLGPFVAWAPLPGIILAIVADDFVVDLPWLLLGARWGLDVTARVFLGFTATLWLVAGVFARSYLADDPDRDRFELFWLLTMTGNLAVIVAQDMVSFLLFFTLMSLSAYGLITHDRKAASLRAGRIYIAMTVLGEVVLFWAVILTFQQTGSLYFNGLAEALAASPMRDVIAGLLLIGFGIKLGLMPLHFWLPLAHPAAPTPASAVLSGAIIKTGLLGLLRFMPLGAAAMPELGGVCIGIGIASAFIAVLIGVTQDNPKTVLAYSSVSQMGLVTIALGAALMVPAAWKVIAAALLLFATHHAVAKAALFLGVGVSQSEITSRWRRTLVCVGLVTVALSLSGMPLTSGLVAKVALKYAVATTAEPWLVVLQILLPLTGITTTLLLARFLYLVWPNRQSSHKALSIETAVPWGVLSAGVVVMFFVLRFGELVKPTWTSLSPGNIWAAAWPILIAGVILYLLHANASARRWLATIRIPAGDLVIPLTLAVESCRRAWQAIAVAGLSTLLFKIRYHVARSATDAVRYILHGLGRGLENDLAAGLFVGLLLILMLALVVL